MTNINVTRLTGFIMPVGNGAVGKTTISRMLDSVSKGNLVDEEIIDAVSKTKNLEFEFASTQQTFGNNQYNISLQFLVPPGQKESEGDGTSRSFEKVIEIYKESIRRIDVVLFTYDLSNRESYHDLEYWIHAVGELFNQATHFILLGTHLDKDTNIEVTKEEIETGLAYVGEEILKIHPDWKGKSAHLEVSSITGENLDLLLKYISGSVISSRKIMP